MDGGTTMVDEYVAALPERARTVAESVRSIVHEVTPGAGETVRYNMPVFMVGDQYLVYMGAWKNHVGLYPIPRFDEPLEAKLAPHRTAKDTVRFLYRDPLPVDLVEEIVRALVARLPGAA